MNQSTKSILIFITLALLLGLAVYLPQIEDTATSTGKQCQVTNDLICRFSIEELNNREVIVKFAAPIQLEEENTLSLTLPDELQLNTAWIQGVNMYMGKTPVIKQNSKRENQDRQFPMVFFLGACSEQHMRWQLILQLHNTLTKKTEHYFVNFSTDYR